MCTKEIARITRKINTTEGFWEMYLDDEKIPSKVLILKVTDCFVHVFRDLLFLHP